MNTHHPRFPQRLQTIGAVLFVGGLTTHAAHHPSFALAGVLLTLALCVRLSIEWSIRGDESDRVMERKQKQFNLLNQFSLLAIGFGIFGFLRER